MLRPIPYVYADSDQHFDGQWRKQALDGLNIHLISSAENVMDKAHEMIQKSGSKAINTTRLAQHGVLVRLRKPTYSHPDPVSPW